MEKIIAQNHEIKNLVTFRQFLQHNQISQVIEENILFKEKDIQSIVFREFLPLYFRSNQEYVKLKEKYSYFLNFFESCKKLRIYSISWMKEILKNKELPERIYSEKETKLKQSFEKFKPYKITNQEIDAIFRRFIENDLITPSLLNTITTSSFAKYHPIILLKDTTRVNTQLQKIVRLFPRVLLNRFRNLLNNESVIYIFTFFLNIKEKELLCSILFNIFKEDIINFKRLFTSGLYPILFLKDFYDLTKNEFFYTKDLFGQQFLEIQEVLGDQQKPPQEIKTGYPEKFWSKEKNILDLVKEVGKRVSHEQISFNIDMMTKLINFHDNLNPIILNPERFKNTKQEQFFKNYIKSIKFIPNFQAFGLTQFFLYINSSNVDEIDLKHLLINSFQTIKYPTVIDKTNSFLIKYIFPYDNPNVKHLNWYTKTKHIVPEYCLFSIKKIHQILNFNYNLSAKGWDYDSNRFKIYFQNILFNPHYKVEFTKIKQFNMEKQDFEGPNTIYFQALSKIYTHRSIDLKSYLGTIQHSTIDNILTLLKQNLIFPYISLRNLDFQDKIYLILPNVREEYNQTIIKIFNFFNYAFISEIEGQYYIYGVSDDNPIKFENGLMIKLYLPQCEVDEFLRLFDLLFEYLEIDDYIVLTDLASGKNLLKEIYGDLHFLDSYSPLTNLKWNDKDKIWMNHKLYTEKFEKIYPDLIPPDNV